MIRKELNATNKEAREGGGKAREGRRLIRSEEASQRNRGRIRGSGNETAGSQAAGYDEGGFRRSRRARG